MDVAGLIKVIMLTAFLGPTGHIVRQERTFTNLAVCEQAREEAIHFNDRFQWPWAAYFNDDTGRVFVACILGPGTTEV